jgi:hypothetical protein
MTLDHIIDVHIRGISIDQLRDEIAGRSYKSVLTDSLSKGTGAPSSHDAAMIHVASMIPKRYASNIIDEINQGFDELKIARPVRYDTVILHHISKEPRTQQALRLGLTINQFKNELSMGREYLAVRFVDFLIQATA